MVNWEMGEPPSYATSHVMSSEKSGSCWVSTEVSLGAEERERGREGGRIGIGDKEKRKGKREKEESRRGERKGRRGGYILFLVC